MCGCSYMQRSKAVEKYPFSLFRAHDDATLCKSTSHIFDMQEVSKSLMDGQIIVT